MITIGSSLLFALSLSEIKEASPHRLGCIKGIGEKRLQRITTYQKEHTISKMEDLLNIKGIGVKILENIQYNRLKKSCQSDKQSPISKSNPPRKKVLNAQ